MDTVFYFNNNIFIEFLTKVKKKNNIYEINTCKQKTIR